MTKWWNHHHHNETQWEYDNMIGISLFEYQNRLNTVEFTITVSYYNQTISVCDIVQRGITIRFLNL